MANYTVGGYAQNAFMITPDGQVVLDPDFDASEDAFVYEIEESDGGVKFNGDDANDEVGDGDQYAKKYDANGNQLAEGEVYLEESWTLTDGQGNTITLYKVESNGQHSGWVADGPITPGTAYAYSGPNDVTAGNAPRYDELVAPSDDPDGTNTYEGGAYRDYQRTGAGDDTVQGHGGDDDIRSGSGDDSVDAGSGNDSADGGDGNDTIEGRDGDDTLQGGAGDDSITGGAGDDQLSGGDGNDILEGGDGSDTIDGGAGDDTIFYGRGGDSVSGGDGNDVIDEQSGRPEWDYDDTIDGGDGDDTVYAGWGDDSIDGGADDDALYGDVGDDTIQGGSGDDYVSGGEGDDQIEGGSGDDHLRGKEGDDTISGGEGDDTIEGGSGDDSLSGNAGNDSIDGLEGNNTIDGGEGDDTIDGGSGNSTVTGGAGDDTFSQSQGGTMVVTDFDTGDDDSDGSYNDQIDVSDLRTPDGHPVNAFDVVVTDDGNGNALLTFPEGETLVLQGVSPAQMSSAQQLNAAGIPCFAAGTSIATARGPVLVEALRPGDRVQTRDNGLRPVRWIGSRHVTRHDLATNPMLRPIHIAPGTFANTDALRLSAQHALALDTARGVTQLVRAGHLARLHGGAVRVAHGVHRVTYYHLLLDSHDLIMAGGVPCESFYPGPWGLLSVGPRATRDLIRLMPELRRVPVADCYGAPAHPVARFGGLPPDLRDLRAAA